MAIRMIVASLVLLSVVGISRGQEPETTAMLADTEAVTFFPRENFWITGEYWLGWVQGENLPALVTTSDVGTPLDKAGILGLTPDTTQTLVSGKVNEDSVSGFRFETGYLWDREYGQGIEAGFSFLGSQSTDFSFTQDDVASGILARPFRYVRTATPADPKNNTNQAIVIAHPDQSDGSIGIRAETGNFYEAHFDFCENIYESNGFVIDGLIGYRFGHFDDNLRIQQTILPDALPGTAITSTDEFDARNNFHGLDMGLRARFAWENLSLSLLGKLSAGNMRRTVNIKGRQVTDAGGMTSTASGGAYALASNIGEYSSNEGTVLPEFGATMQWKVNNNWKLRFGYTTLFLDKVARAADQIDFKINPDLFPGPGFDPDATPQRPRFRIVESDVWIQSINFGADFTF